MSHHFTLHVRLTRKCNADCAYCSSWRDGELGSMTPAQFARSLDFLIPHLRSLGFARGRGQTMSVQYVGGEVLTVPSSELKAIVLMARDRFSDIFDHVRDGVQSNLIGSPSRLTVLSALFASRISTSVDHYSEQRTIDGDAKKYRVFAIKSADRLRRTGRDIPAIFVVDQTGLQHAEQEYRDAERAGHGLTLRAVFNGGRGVNEAPPEAIAALYGRIFDAWVMQGRIAVEPLYQLLYQRLGRHGVIDMTHLEAGCPFQNNCADVSLNLDPNGDLYLCLDTADSNQMRLGNALAGEFDWALWRQIQARSQHLDASCRTCPYQRECGGGCLSEGYHQTGSPWGKTGLCVVWKTLFAKIDAVIERHGAPAVRDWLFSLGAHLGAQPHG